MHADPVRPHDTVACLRLAIAAIYQCELTYLVEAGSRTPSLFSNIATTRLCWRASVLRSCLLPPELQLADATFVEDVALVFDEIAVIASLIASRRAETASMTRFLAAYRHLAFIPQHARLEGVAVIRKRRTIYGGQSKRTDRAGVIALRGVHGRR